MKRWLLIALLFPASLHAQLGGFTGFCTQGGTHAVTSGLAASNYHQGIVPSCTVTVFLTGTTTLAPNIYSNAGGTPLSNPFTATALGSVAPGQWTFYAPTTSAYDVVLSGGILPNVYPAPVTLPGLGSSGGGGGGASPPSYSVQFSASPTSTQFASDSTITITPSTHTMTSPEFYAPPGTATGLPGVTAPNLASGLTPTVDIRAYGAVSGAADITSDLQAAVNEAFTIGGQVYIPPGIWNVNGPINSACDAIICVPAVPATSAAEQIKIIGATRNRQDAGGPTNESGSVIVTQTIGSDASSAVFGVPSVTTPFGNNLDVYFNDLTIRTYPNPQIGCINTYNAAGASIDHVRCEVGENYTGPHTEPTHIATGITLPATGNDTLANLTWSQVTGYYQGINASEHAYFNGTWVAFGIQGLFIEAGYNPMTGHIGFEEVGLPIATGTAAQLDLDIAIELDPMNVFGCVSWCYSTTDIYDGNNGLRGWVRYYKSEANVGNISTPISINNGGLPSTLATYYNLYTTAFSKMLAPMFTSTGGLPTCTAGTGTTCAVTAGSTEARGSVTITNSSATIDTPLVTINFAYELAGNPWCDAWQAGGTSYYGIYVAGGASANSFAVNNVNTLSGVSSLVIGYECQL